MAAAAWHLASSKTVVRKTPPRDSSEIHTMKCHILHPLLSIIIFCSVAGAGELKETEFSARDALTLLNAQAWSFSYSPSNPTRRLNVLIYETRTEKGKVKTLIHHACTLGMLPVERVFKIKMLLVENELHTSIDAGRRSIKVSDDFITGTFEYRKGGNAVKDDEGRQFMLEIGNEKEYKGKAPFKTELKFKVFENLDQATLKQLLNGGQPPQTA